MNSDSADLIRPQYFSPGDPAAREYLRHHGYTVFKSVVTQEQCKISLGHFWDWIREVSEQQVIPGDVDSYHHWPAHVDDSAILYYQGIGQSEFCWSIRTQPNVIKAFTTLWRNDDLLTSFDGGCIMRPWVHNSLWKTRRSWFHVDQNPLVYPDFDCIQGLVNLLPMTSDSGANLLIPGSHKHFSTYTSRFPETVSNLPKDQHYFEIPQRDPVLNNSNFIPLRLELGVGDLLCWDSRTAHCSCPGTNGKAVETESNLLRATVFVCMVPRSMAKPEVIKARKQAIKSQTTTTHRPHLFSPTNAYMDVEARVKRGVYLKFPKKSTFMTPQRLHLIGYSSKEVQKVSEFTHSR